MSIVRKLKQESTVMLWKIYKIGLRMHFWKERTFWSDGYFCYTVAKPSQQTIRKYIETPG